MLKITLITLGDKMPDWVNQGANEYLKRFKGTLVIKLIELPLTRRSKTSDLAKILDKEYHLIKQTIPHHAYVIALDVEGASFSSHMLAQEITDLQQVTSHLCFLIGGPEGLAAELLNQCDATWSLSQLTLPHTLVRIVLLETLYRAWTIMNNHPYHK